MKNINLKKILSSEEVNVISKAMRYSLGDQIVAMAQDYGIHIDVSVRLISVSNKMKSRREQLGLSIRDVSKQLNIPQYCIRDIELGRSTMLQEVLILYTDCLQLKRWFQLWRKINQSAFKSLQSSNKFRRLTSGSSRRADRDRA